MAGSGLYMNWVNTTIAYTPSGGSLTTVSVTEVLDVEPDIHTKQEMFFGDAKKFPVLIIPTERSRSLKITTGNPAALLPIPENVPCTVTTTLLDAASQSSAAGSGSVTLTLVNAMKKSVGVKATNNKIGGSTIAFEAYGNTGDTDPLTITIL